VIFNAYIETQRLVRTDRYKLVHYPKIGRNQLFDLKEDPHETKDLIKDPKLEKVKQGLLATLRKKRMELGDGMLSGAEGK
ncbi:MAG: sulfatase/phosphatase domain-containing protein, partial [Verrucomicrobiota bacterium]|nr:sulfatase/phosphatase domain-containing protein [Verrucomicrobiota bacterium]